ncbi:hypothetical protein ARMSODRAFT_879949 [Armillaria solidipes]|uniref:Uncharacterized protein n=1 Tax=Armillaria solidipes TaxID=1076256 RepID=A0A2H3CAC0_9AGAR|nr:hypothetical protein ARMSODRAFT_879949 [Armillaria solidipes]
MQGSESVITMYLKGGGKAGAHGWVSSAESIGSLLYIMAQLYEHSHQQMFRTIHQTFSYMALSQFAHLPSYSFLVMVVADGVKKMNDLLEISSPALTLFQELCYKKEKLVDTVARLNTVQGKGNIMEIEEIEDKDE